MILGQVEVSLDKSRMNRLIQERTESLLDDAAEALTIQVKKSMSKPNQSGLRPGTPGLPPRKGKGSLHDSIRWKKESRFVRMVGSSHAYALIHEIGGVINAKNKRLPVPMTPAAKRHAAAGNGPLSFPEKLVAIELGSHTFLRGERDFHYVLKHSVRMPMRPYLRTALYSSQFQRTMDRLSKARR